MDWSLHEGGVHCAHVTPADWTGWQLASKQLARTVHTTYVVHTHSCSQSKDSIVLKSPPQAPASKQETRKQATLASKQRNIVELSSMCGWWFVEVVVCCLGFAFFRALLACQPVLASQPSARVGCLLGRGASAEGVFCTS